MQVNANAQLQTQAYTKLQQQTQQPTAQTTSAQTLQSDTVSLSSDAVAASQAEIQRGGGDVLLPTKKKEN
ncbi:hypothetical protein [Pseudoalteromonas ruthenica]|uniref:hypothetical protein n=1 Tax=Pseudoalteromonas ruthenica TaxID=151081 RepID=UPI00034B30BD|nr:hypothetical protein [Pseudoalteromonas ruthenica]